jgi:hypothetical protein
MVKKKCFKSQFNLHFLQLSQFSFFMEDYWSNFVSSKSNKMKTLISFLLFVIAIQSLAQTEISGKITDEKGIAIPGANIYLEGTYDGASSDENGNFKFNTSQKRNESIDCEFSLL